VQSPLTVQAGYPGLIKPRAREIKSFSIRNEDNGGRKKGKIAIALT
jgi:hypothetical protein